MTIPTFRTFLLSCSAFFLVFPVVFISNAWSTEGLPSQKARFQGMGSTLKANKTNSNSLFSADESKKTVSDETDNNEKIKTKSGTYFKLHTFVINIRDKRYPGKLFYLTLEIYYEIIEPTDKILIETNIAPIKDIIITHASGLFRQEIQTPKQKKTLQMDLTEKVKIKLNTLTGDSVISDLYLTRIIVQ